MGIHFDVRSKVMLILALGICSFCINTLPVEIGLIIFVAVLQAVSDKKSISFKFLIVYGILVLLQLFVLPVLHKNIAMILSVFVVNFRKMFPCIMGVLFLIKTTRVSEAIATMNKMKLPKAITVTFAVTLRYFPVLGEECRNVRAAMKIRQLTLSNLGFAKGIVKKIECYFVPILISATKIAENLSAAAITRGIENPSGGQCRGYRKMGLQDYLLLALEIFFIVYSIYFKIRRH